MCYKTYLKVWTAVNQPVFCRAEEDKMETSSPCPSSSSSSHKFPGQFGNAFETRNGNGRFEYAMAASQMSALHLSEARANNGVSTELLRHLSLQRNSPWPPR